MHDDLETQAKQLAFAKTIGPAVGEAVSEAIGKFAGNLGFQSCMTVCNLAALSVAQAMALVLETRTNLQLTKEQFQDMATIYVTTQLCAATGQIPLEHATGLLQTALRQAKLPTSFMSRELEPQAATEKTSPASHLQN